MHRWAALFLLLLFFSFCAHTQNTIGIPGIVNYPKSAYNAGTQNWGITQDANGLLYFANSQGLLSFDGTFWRLYPLPNKTIVRSVAAGDSGRIYVGGQSELGYFSPAPNGELAYTSLMPLLKDGEKDFTDVWNICSFGGHIFFRAYRKVLEYTGRKVIVYDGIHWSFLGAAASSLLAFDYTKGLVRYEAGRWQPLLHDRSLPAGVNLRSAVSIGRDSVLLATLTNGLYLLHKDSLSPFTSKDITPITEQNIYGALPLGHGQIALITSLSGCSIIDQQGRFIQRFSKKEGVQNNNVLSAFLDKDKNLWLGLDNGIDLILYSNAIHSIFPEGEDRNSGFTSIRFHHQLYLGLSSGAYVLPLDSTTDISYTHGSFTAVKGSKGQVWNFSEVNGQLLMGHNAGAYTIDGTQAQSLDDKTGFWNFQPLGSNPSEGMFAGTYNGINFYNYNEGRFSNPRRHAQFESARFVVRQGRAIWVAHPFKGLYCVHRREDDSLVVDVYPDRQKILSANHNKLFALGGRMVLTTDNGIFVYDEQQGDFIRSPAMEQVFGIGVSYLKEDRYGNVWFCQNRKVGVWDKSFVAPRTILLPELNNRIQADGFENINVIDSNNVLIAGEKGFFHINYALYRKNNYPLRVLIRGVRSISDRDSLIYGGYQSLLSTPSLSYAFNSLRFQCSSTLYGQDNAIEYSYYLEGFDHGWSGWSKRPEKDYTNIPPGDYVFQIRCRNNSTNESPPARFSFIILPPWYRTWWAYAFYAALFAGLLYLFYKRQQQKYGRRQQEELLKQQRAYNEEQKRLQMQYRLELSEIDKQVAQLRSEKLQSEVEHKNSELASTAMGQVHRLEILTRIKESLVQFRDSHADKGTKEMQKIIKLIDGELGRAGDWEQFARHFDNVHTNYLKKLKAFCPDLTVSDLKLAAYLRLQLSTKEMAQLMNISTRGVETSRYRLRKKLGLTNDEANLYDFLLQITEG